MSQDLGLPPYCYQKVISIVHKQCQMRFLIGFILLIFCTFFIRHSDTKVTEDVFQVQPPFGYNLGPRPLRHSISRCSCHDLGRPPAFGRPCPSVSKRDAQPQHRSKERRSGRHIKQCQCGYYSISSLRYNFIDYWTQTFSSYSSYKFELECVKMV